MQALSEVFLIIIRFGGGLSGKSFVFFPMEFFHFIFVQTAGEDAQIQPFNMNMIEMPDENKYRGDNCFSAVRHFGGRDNSARQDLRNLHREPDDKSTDTHERQTKEQEPVGHLLFKVVF